MKNLKLKNRRKVEGNSRIFIDYFNTEVEIKKITKNRPFGGGSYLEEHLCFFAESTGKWYAILGYDHFNGHFSGFKDPSAVYGLYIAEVY